MSAAGKRKVTVLLSLKSVTLPAALGGVLRYAADNDWVTVKMNDHGMLLLYTAPKTLLERQVIVVFRQKGTDTLQFTCAQTSGNAVFTAQNIADDFARYFKETVVPENKQRLLRYFNRYAAEFGFASLGFAITPKTETTPADRLRSFLNPKDVGPFFVVIVAANLLSFLWSVFSGAGFFETKSEYLLNAGALYAPAVINGEYWRFFTTMFLHDGFVHFGYNMLALVYALAFLKDYMHTFAILMVYIASGIIASSVSLWYHPNVFAVGASGAVFGLYGIVISLAFFGGVDKKEAGGAAIIMGIMGGISLLAGLKEGVDNAAHIGGLLGGVLCGGVIQPLFKFHNYRWFRYLYPPVLLPVAVLVAWVLLNNTDRTPAMYIEALDKFEQLEKDGMLYYRDDIKNGKDSLRLAVLRNNCIPAWNEAKELLIRTSNLRGLDMDQALRIERLLRYCELRLQTTDILIWYYSDDTRYSVFLSDSLFKALTATLDTLNDKVTPAK